MKRIIFLLFFFPFLSFGQGPVDGFVKGKGNLDLALSAAYQHSGRFYAGTTLIDYERNLTCLSLFGEYGIGHNTDAIVSIPFINGQFQDASLFLKHRFVFPSEGRGIVIMPALGVSFPISDYATETGQSIGQQATQIQPKLVLQNHVIKRFFFQVQGGYNYALDPVPSSVPISAKIGFIHNSWYFDAWFDRQRGLGDKEWLTDPISSFRELYVTYSKIGGVVYYQFKAPQKSGDRYRPGYGFFINGSYLLNGINIGKSFMVGTGIVCKLDVIRDKPVNEKP